MSNVAEIALDNEMLRRYAPSVFATAPAPEVSDRYGFVPTIDIVDALRTEGWLPVKAKQRNVRNASRRELATHALHFRLNDDRSMTNVGDSVVELLLKNSHDRSSAYTLHAGVFRLVCSNGLVVADSTFAKMSVRHGKNIVDDILEGSYEIIREVPAIASQVENMVAVDLSTEQRRNFALDAYNMAFGEIDHNNITGKDNIINQMLRARRYGDSGTDLWTTMNVIQENIIRGGITTRHLNEKVRSGVRQSTSRAVKNIEKDIKLNKALWGMADAYLEAA